MQLLFSRIMSFALLLLNTTMIGALPLPVNLAPRAAGQPEQIKDLIRKSECYYIGTFFVRYAFLPRPLPPLSLARLPRSTRSFRPTA